MKWTLLHSKELPEQKKFVVLWEVKKENEKKNWEEEKGTKRWKSSVKIDSSLSFNALSEESRIWTSNQKSKLLSQQEHFQPVYAECDLPNSPSAKLFLNFPSLPYYSKPFNTLAVLIAELKNLFKHEIWIN